MGLIRLILFSGALTCAAGSSSAQDGARDPSFNIGDSISGANDVVFTTVLQPDGKVLIGGLFTNYNGTPRKSIARLHPDGRLDMGFNPGTGTGFFDTATSAKHVYAIAVQPDGKVIIGGWFYTYSGIVRNSIARLNSDGSLDLSFNPGTGANWPIKSIVLQPDGKVVIGGNFTSYNGTVRNGIARLNSDGTLDTGFNPGTGAISGVESIALQPDGKLILGGYFSSYNGNPRNRIARVNINGSLDTGFNPGTGADTVVFSTVLQPDGKVIIGGLFTSYNGTVRNRIARLNSDGSLDTGFNPGTGASGDVMSIALQPDGKVTIGGYFISYNGTARNRLARLNSDGSLDTGFNPGSGPITRVYSISVRSDGKSIVGGWFSGYNGTTRDNLALINSDGSADMGFSPCSGANEFIQAIALQPDGKMIIGGLFTSFNGTVRNRIARLNSDGTLDTGFDPGAGANEDVQAIALQPDGKIIIGGNFTSYNGTIRYRIARLNSDGTLDTGFNPGAGAQGTVRTITLQSDGKLIIGGSFSAYNYIARNCIARLNSNGILDTDFNPGTGFNSGSVYSLVLQPDGKLIIGGFFNSYNGTMRSRLARLNSDASLDTGFDPGTGPTYGVNSICLQPDGKYIIGGAFSSYNGTVRNYIARINSDGSLDTVFNPGTGTDNGIYSVALQPDGKVIIAGDFGTYNGTARNSIARLNSDGSLDTEFDPSPGFIPSYPKFYLVRTVAMQPDGKVGIVGGFTSYYGPASNRIARINGTARTGIKLMLEGPYSGGQMTDALRTLPSFPLTEPFTAMGYAETGYVSGAAIGSSVLSTTGNNAIVDWVIVEMRPAAALVPVAASRAVLLQRDGDVVDLDGVSNVGFTGLAAGNYCVAVRHRNHLPVMTSPSTPVAFGNGIATVDFTLPGTLVYDNDARKNVGGVMVLAAGDVTFNGTVQYTGSNNDRDAILSRIGGIVPTNTANGYFAEDVNMDGTVKYSGSVNDRDIVLQSIGGIVPTNTRVASLP